jgi:hypothetical protein
MGVVVTFTGYTPIARFDDLPWTDVEVQEAAASSGSWSTIDTLALDPVDADPTTPASRDFTTENGTGADKWYRVIFVDGNGDTSEPTSAVRNVATPGDSYITAEALKRTLTLNGTTFANDDVDEAIVAASRAVDDACGRFFGRDSSAEVERIYRPQSATVCLIDDLVELTSLETDQNGDGEVERTWVQNREFVLEPLNAAADSRPYTKLSLNSYRASVAFPFWAPRSVKVTGRFGWPAIPANVPTATSLVASRLVKRLREAPFGIVANNMDGSALQIARTDPDVARLLKDLTRERLF